MKERPILFSAPMVRALLAGTKKQTRRVMKLRGEPAEPPMPFRGRANELTGEWGICYTPRVITQHVRCPYGMAGERLWVRETFGYVSPHEGRAPIAECNIEYRADLPPGCTDQPGQWPADEARGEDEAPKWRPSIFMPRRASRITLEVVSVRVERLQDISEADAQAEGVAPYEPDDAVKQGPRWFRMGYEYLWEKINGKGSWESNPWVWCVEFKRVLT